MHAKLPGTTLCLKTRNPSKPPRQAQCLHNVSTCAGLQTLIRNSAEREGTLRHKTVPQTLGSMPPC